MENFWSRLTAYFNKRNTFRIVVIELQIIGLLLCVLLAMSVEIDLSLNGDPVMTVEKGTAFVDPGAKATADNRTIDVKVTGTVDADVPGTYTLCYRARYLLSSKEISRTVHVVNTQPPVITLEGDAQIHLTLRAEYVEPGYRAANHSGADLTAQVQVAGEVDTTRAGTYTITYSVTDAAGRTTTVQRTVTVEPAQQPEVVQPEGKVIYLTFDDGPGTHTERLLEVLDKYDVKATFFVVGTNAKIRPQLLKAIVDGGHSIGLHSMDHDFAKIYASQEAFLQDMYELQDLVEKHTGVTTTLLRFPGGTSNTVSKNYCQGVMTQLVEAVTDLGFQYFDWNVDSKDAGGAKTADEVYQNVIKGISGQKMTYVLQHDIKGFSVDAVEKIIQWGLENGYTFLPLTPESPAYHHGVNN